MFDKKLSEYLKRGGSMAKNILMIKNTYCIILIFFISFMLITVSGMAQDAQSFYQNGYQFFSQGNYQKAAENYQKAIDLDQDFEDAHYWLGKVYRQTGQHDKAVQQWIEVLRINPRNPYALRYLNESFRNTSRVQNGNANDYYNEGLKMLEVGDETFLNENSYSNQALLLSIPYFKRAIDLQSDFIAAHYWLAEIYQALAKKVSWQYTSMAISSFEKVIEIEEEKNLKVFERPSEYWYAHQELMLIYQSLGLNERRENLLSKLEEMKSAPYEQVLSEAGYSNFGYPDQIEIIKQDEDIIELWKYEEENKVFRVVNKEIVGEELSYDQYQENKGSQSEEFIEEMEMVDEEEM
jgi:tetratricopeptide (TPR) repeat protein